MRLKSLILERFGPFAEYQLNLPSDDRACVLLTGKNNAGKSSIIRALKLLDKAMKAAKQSREPVRGILPKKYYEELDISRLIHNYVTDDTATITGIFDSGREVTVEVNGVNNTIAYGLPAFAHRSMVSLLGFIPQLGQLADRETLLGLPHILTSLDTTLAPRHLRNHIHQLLNEDQRSLLRSILNDSWEGIEFQELKFDQNSAVLYYLYNENSIPHEIAWAGQGLQIWMQIMTHMVRLNGTSTLILDEPDIFLHPEKQHHLVRIIRENYTGSAIIATHSPELMADDNITHVIHVEKNLKNSRIFRVSERNGLEGIGINIGSHFNFVASQFEDVELMIATENRSDYDVVHQIALEQGIKTRTQNVPIYGFRNYHDASHYKRFFATYFGKQVACSLLLDKDYYPQSYLDQIREEMSRVNVEVVFTPGKEIENLFIDEGFLSTIVPDKDKSGLQRFLDTIYQREYDNCWSRYLEFHNKLPVASPKALSSTYRDFKPHFDAMWKDKRQRAKLIPGKTTLAELRVFFKDHYGLTLPTSLLTKRLVETNNRDAKELVAALFPS